MSYNLRSLAITGIFGLMVPLCIIAGFFGTFLLVGMFPIAHVFAAQGMHHLIHILQTFGNGSIFQGSLIIAIAISVVAVLFDVCNLLILSKPIR